MIKYICDCCGKEIKKGEIKQIKVHNNYTNRVEKEGIHWCKDCVSNNGKPGFNFPILDTSKKECMSNEDCEGCKILDILGLIACPCDSATFPEDWEIEREKDE